MKHSTEERPAAPPIHAFSPQATAPALTEIPYRWLFENSLDGIALTDPNGAILAANPAFCRMLGYSEDELRARGRAGVVDRDDPRLAEAMAQRRDTGAFVGELTLIARDGRRIPVELSSQIVRDAVGRELTSMFVRDISPRVRALDELRRSEERFKVALRNSPITVSTVDADLRYTWLYNPHPNFRIADALGKRDVDLAQEGDVAELVALKQEVLATGRGIQREVRVTVGAEQCFYDVTAEPIRDTDGTVIGVTSAATDISARRRGEEEQRFLARAGEILATTLDYRSTIERIARLAVPVIGDACIVDVDAGNQPILVVAHLEPEVEALIRSVRERFPPAPGSAHPVAVARRTAEPVLLPELSSERLDAISMGAEHRLILGRIGARSALAVPLVAGGRVLGALTTFSTTRVLGERDLAVAVELARRAALAIDNAHAYALAREASTTRDEVLGIVSHDLRNAVGTIALSLELLDRTHGPAEFAKLKERIVRSSEWMAHIIDDLVDVTAMEAGRLSINPDVAAMSSVAEVVQGIYEPRALARGVALRVAVAPLPPIRCDANRIIQASGNLVENAIRFTPRGGTVTFAIAPHADGVVLRVTDTGPGIAAEDLPRIFDRFWQAKKSRRGGAGLGLAIAKGIAEAHGGRIEVRSEMGHGSTFDLVLPAA